MRKININDMSLKLITGEELIDSEDKTDSENEELNKKYKDEDETILLAKIAEEGRGGPELYTSMIQEEGRAGPPSFEVKRAGRGGASRKRKNRTKQKLKKSRKGKSKKLRRGKH